MKKLAIFDMDGTLFDTRDVNYYSYSKALEEGGFNIDYDYYCNYCNGRHYTVFLPSMLNNDKKLIENIHNRKKELYAKYLDKAKINVHLFSIIENIKKDYYIALVTTASSKNTLQILNYFNKTSLFDLILTSNEIVRPKPDPEGFDKAMQYFKVTPENTIIFEDSDVGIEAALKTKSNVIKIIKF